MSHSFSSLQQEYPEFVFESFTYALGERGLDLTFTFKTGDIEFHPSLCVEGVTQEQLAELSREELDAYVFSVGMAEIASYWKSVCSSTIRINAGKLSVSQQYFWKDVIKLGLGEFFYVNKLVPFAPSLIVEEPTTPQIPSSFQPSQESSLVPVGGGKDSIVTLELLASAHTPLSVFTVNENQSSTDTITTFETLHGNLAHIHVTRRIDPKLLELNAQEYLNGHTPFSSVLAFVSVFAARLFGHSFVVLSNEQSANEATVMYHDIAVNHQYSKTIAFESAFRTYLDTLFTVHPDYFSFLRPVSEFAITKLFSTYTPYHPYFRSCNIGKKTNSWCGHCPKCVFVAIMLSVFIGEEQVAALMGKHILQDATLLPIVDELTGRSPIKPFECIGTRDEVNTAIALIIEQSKAAGKAVPALLASYEKTDASRDTTHLFQLDTNHHLPESFFSVLQSSVAAISGGRV